MKKIILYLFLICFVNLNAQEKEKISFSEMVKFSKEIKKEIGKRKNKSNQEKKEKENQKADINKSDVERIFKTEKKIMWQTYTKNKKNINSRKNFRNVFDLAITLGLFQVAQRYGNSIEKIKSDWMDSGSYYFYMSYVYALNEKKHKSDYYWKIGNKKVNNFKDKKNKRKKWWHYKKFLDEAKKIRDSHKDKIKNFEVIQPEYKNSIKELFNNLGSKEAWDKYYEKSKEIQNNINKIVALRFLLEYFKEKDVNRWVDLASTYYWTKQYQRVIKLRRDFVKEGLEKEEMHYYTALSYKEIGQISNAKKEIIYIKSKFSEYLEKHKWRKDQIKKLERELQLNVKHTGN